MKLEDQVCSLELSKRLKELGVKQESLFYWSKLSIQAEYKIELRTNIFTQEIIFADCTDYISAFTVAELGEMLPCILQADTASKNDSLITTFKNYNDQWMVAYSSDDRLPPTIAIMSDTEADARAKMLIRLIENSLVEVPK